MEMQFLKIFKIFKIRERRKVIDRMKRNNKRWSSFVIAR